MKKITQTDLLNLEQYHEQRAAFRERARVHKAERRLAIGSHASLYFEDYFTMQYQVQEMLYAEKIFTKEEIQGELDTYNPLVPDGDNWKATFMLEYSDVAERKNALEKLVGIEDRVFVAIEGFNKIYAFSDEDLERADETKTSAVHFLRFQFDAAEVWALKNNTQFIIGIDHPEYQHTASDLPKELIEQLLGDLD